ncbi:MAG: hypothetical protein QCI82_10080 [Candidatus Thermoplasmatota archaeon]|nr:hypothetical protein [Candidatus Thermoplasmatota archaeon]
MKYKSLFIIFAIIIISIPLAILIKNNIDNNVVTKGKYEIFISKNANSSIEKIASTTTENIDYSSIYGVERYYLSLQGMNSYQCYSNNMSFNEKTYVWANFIDDIGLKDYGHRIDHLRNNNIDVRVHLMYEEDVRYQQSVQIEYMNDHWYLKNIYNVSILTNSFERYFGMVAICDENNTLTVNQKLEYINRSYDDCFLLEINFHYHEQYGPTSGFSTNIIQIILIDKNYQPVLISIYEKKGIS